ncbi:uncharacterized protein TRIADDRAFT_51696 [Trichoplax adhaerens]|uniref:Uncharacterized protein n=1 Tax=Trichoplax adhaerens TaxID=10228 RepID=B3RKI8_TRIAD|nr:hypothetical protein TRIADDRAFT_51696 [Trichoplax adhaerens]EDV29410.1 hypothetical protein TRIADDRAFT_51696 [Trichoplax adhaerens]|eukprot:XP_002108612.1 hypothetical protein TRIADDRAFT_51696 [Trichoplax adhaerens]
MTLSRIYKNKRKLKRHSVDASLIVPNINQKASDKDQLIFTGAFQLYQSNVYAGVCGVAELPLPATLHILSQSFESGDTITAFHILKGNRSHTAQTLSQQQLYQAIKDTSRLSKDHSAAWRQIWHPRLAVTSFNGIGNHRNKMAKKTIRYYLLSMYSLDGNNNNNTFHRRAFVSQLDLAWKNSLNYTCYDAPMTMYNEKLWPYSLTNMPRLKKLFKAWRYALRKGGCDQFFNRGLPSFNLGMLLSLIGLKFASNQLQLPMKSIIKLKDDVYLENLYYNGSYVDVNVVKGKFIEVSSFLSERKHPLFACDASCSSIDLIGWFLSYIGFVTKFIGPPLFYLSFLSCNQIHFMRFICAYVSAFMSRERYTEIDVW